MDAKYATAGNMFRQAGHIFALKHRFQEAGDAFCMESDCREHDGEGKVAAVAWWNAVNAYKRAEPSDSLPETIDFQTYAGCVEQLVQREGKLCTLYDQDDKLPERNTSARPRNIGSGPTFVTALADMDLPSISKNDAPFIHLSKPARSPQ